MVNPVLVEDLEDRFRPLNPLEKTAAQAWLGDAWEELSARVPGLAERMADRRTTPGLVRRVIAAMVIRVLRNPEAIKQWAVDDASFTRDNLVASGMLYASEDEIGLLLGTPVIPAGHVAFSASYGYGRS